MLSGSCADGSGRDCFQQRSCRRRIRVARGWQRFEVLATVLPTDDGIAGDGSDGPQPRQ